MTTQAPITHHLWRNENRPTRNNNDAICALPREDSDIPVATKKC
ncbi:Uncharacterised protein [Mycobacteroides abscessus subsp. abscessus]|nr:Uncharacterised protein [Mycobacteroides abscessus subsp. abscessus]